MTKTPVLIDVSAGEFAHTLSARWQFILKEEYNMRKVLSVFVAVCLVLSLCTGIFVSVPSARADTDGVYIWTVDGSSNATITGYTGAGGDVTIPGTLGGYPVSSIGLKAFYYCSALTSVIIPVGVTSIGLNAFDHCSGLTSVIIPVGVTSIGNNAFNSCSSLPSVTIPGSVTSIGQQAFMGCSKLTSVTIGSGVASIGGYAFQNCSALPNVTIPNSVTRIDFGAFQGCSALTSVTISNSVTAIDVWAFAGCSALTSVTIPVGVTSIGYDAFNGCTSLTSVTIPSSVTSIGTVAFAGCTKLIAAYFLGDAPTGTTNMFSGCGSGFTVWYVSSTIGWTTPTWYGYPTATTYTVTFDKNGGDTEASPTTSTGILYNGTATLPTTNPTLTGSTFNGWFTLATGGTAFTASTPVTADVTVYAQWLSSDASIEAGTLGGVALDSLPRDGAGSISSSAYIGVTVSVGDKALEFTKGNVNSVIKYVLITTGNSPQPADDAAYTGTYTSGSTTISITSSNDRIWLLVTAQDGINKGYYWITVYVANASQAAPTGLAGVAPTTFGGTDGTITGTTTAMEYKLSTASTYTTVTGTSITGLAAGTYNVRYAAKTGFNAGATTAVTVPAYVAPTTTTYAVTFDIQGGSAVAAITGITSGATVTLPAAPTKTGYTLNGWFTAITGGTAFTAATAVTANVTVYAQWTGTYIPAPAPAPERVPAPAPAPVPAPAPAPVPVPAKNQTVLILQIGKTMFWDNSIPTKLDSTPVIKNSRTLLPIRAIIEALGGTVAWDPIAHKVTVTLGTKTVVLWIGKSLATVNGVSTPIDATDASDVPEIINGRTMLPLRFVSENLGCTVLWGDATQTITITYQP